MVDISKERRKKGGGKLGISKQSQALLPLKKIKLDDRILLSFHWVVNNLLTSSNYFPSSNKRQWRRTLEVSSFVKNCIKLIVYIISNFFLVTDYKNQTTSCHSQFSSLPSINKYLKENFF